MQLTTKPHTEKPSRTGQELSTWEQWIDQHVHIAMIMNVRKSKQKHSVPQESYVQWKKEEVIPFKFCMRLYILCNIIVHFPRK